MIQIKKIALIIVCLTSALVVKGKDIYYSKADSLTYESYIRQFASKKNKPLGELITATAQFFLGRPYVASTLEITDNEMLVVNLREFDCTTLVENSIALSKVIQSGDHSFSNYCNLLTKIRYRNANIEGYSSRLHYTSDWLYNNEQKELLEDLTLAFGGEMVNKPLSFMSTHPQFYKHLKDDIEEQEEIANIEEDINRREALCILPQSFIKLKQEDIKDGDIIAFATSTKGLDYSHIAIAFWQDGMLHFIHASSNQKKVVVEKKTLLHYCTVSRSCTGISIARIR